MGGQLSACPYSTSPTKNLIDNRLPLSPLCAYHAPRRPPTCGDPTVFTTTRRAASLRSSKNLNCVIEISLPVRRTSYKRLTPYGPFAAVPLLENGGFNQILPFLGGRSDAACCVVIWPSRPHLWEPMVFITPHCYGGHSLRSTPPLPSAQ